MLTLEQIFPILSVWKLPALKAFTSELSVKILLPFTRHSAGVFLLVTTIYVFLVPFIILFCLFYFSSRNGASVLANNNLLSALGNPDPQVLTHTLPHTEALSATTSVLDVFPPPNYLNLLCLKFIKELGKSIKAVPLATVSGRPRNTNSERIFSATCLQSLNVGAEAGGLSVCT